MYPIPSTGANVHGGQPRPTINGDHSLTALAVPSDLTYSIDRFANFVEDGPLSIRLAQIAAGTEAHTANVWAAADAQKDSANNESSN
ncbi:hypothetical protein ACHAQJ_002440 [Trichoderma viride]